MTTDNIHAQIMSASAKASLEITEAALQMVSNSANARINMLIRMIAITGGGEPFVRERVINMLGYVKNGLQADFADAYDTMKRTLDK